MEQRRTEKIKQILRYGPTTWTGLQTFSDIFDNKFSSGTLNRGLKALEQRGEVIKMETTGWYILSDHVEGLKDAVDADLSIYHCIKDHTRWLQDIFPVVRQQILDADVLSRYPQSIQPGDVKCRDEADRIRLRDLSQHVPAFITKLEHYKKKLHELQELGTTVINRLTDEIHSRLDAIMATKGGEKAVGFSEWNMERDFSEAVVKSLSKIEDCQRSVDSQQLLERYQAEFERLRAMDGSIKQRDDGEVVFSLRPDPRTGPLLDRHVIHMVSFSSMPDDRFAVEDRLNRFKEEFLNELCDRQDITENIIHYLELFDELEKLTGDIRRRSVELENYHMLPGICGELDERIQMMKAYS